MSLKRPPLDLLRLETRDVPTAFTDLPEIPDLNPLVLTHLDVIAAQGRQLGRRTDAFIRIGDSNTATTNYLTPIGAAGYDPVASGLTAVDPALAGVVATFRHTVDSTGANSFTRTSLAATPGWKIADSLAAEPSEVAAVNPAVALILIGTNDVAGRPAGEYQTMLDQLVTQTEAAGVIPVLSTLPDIGTPDQVIGSEVRLYNQAVADVAEQDRVPVLNLWKALQPLPNEGRISDNVHLTVSPNGGGAFQPADLGYGQNVRGLLTLQTLQAIQNEVFAAAPNPRVTAQAAATAWTALAAGTQYYVTGPDRDLPPVVNVYDAGTGKVVDSFNAYSADFRGGVQVALGDVNGDGVPDVVTAPGSGGGPNIRVYSGRDGSLIANFFAYEPSFRGGANVAVADLDGDGRGEIIVGSGVGGGPRVRVFRASDLTVLRDFFAYESTFRGGVNVAAGDFGGTTGPAVVAGSGVGGGPAVRVYRYADQQLVSSFFAYDSGARGGVYVAAGDLDGDGRDDIVTGPGTDAPNVKVFDPATAKQKLSFLSGQAGVGGVRVGVIPQAGTAEAQIVTGNGPGAPSAVRLYPRLDGTNGTADTPGDATDLNGTYVAG